MKGQANNVKVPNALSTKKQKSYRTISTVSEITSHLWQITGKATLIQSIHIEANRWDPLYPYHMKEAFVCSESYKDGNIQRPENLLILSSSASVAEHDLLDCLAENANSVKLTTLDNWKLPKLKLESGHFKQGKYIWNLSK